MQRKPESGEKWTWTFCSRARRNYARSSSFRLQFGSFFTSDIISSPIAGASDRIVSLRFRYDQLNSSIARYESKVSRQMTQLAKMNKHNDDNGDSDDADGEALGDEGQGAIYATEEDIRREDDEIRELERKKRQLEDRVKGMDRDLGGLMR